VGAASEKARVQGVSPGMCRCVFEERATCETAQSYGCIENVKTKQLERYDTKPEEELETAKRGGMIKPGYGGTWVLREDPLSLHIAASRNYAMPPHI